MSGFSPRVTSVVGPLPIEPSDEEPETSTAAGYAGHGSEPSTLGRGSATLPYDAPAPRLPAKSVSFDDETQARAVDGRLLEKMRRDGDLPSKADLAVDYESLPSLEVRHPYDTYEDDFAERDPVTHASTRLRQADAVATREPSYREPSYREPSDAFALANDAQNEEELWGRREGSGPRERPQPPQAPPPSPRSYVAPAPALDDASSSSQWARVHSAATGFSSMPPRAAERGYEQPLIPPAPRVPDEMRPAFVVGVQPLRTATPQAWGGGPGQAPAPGGASLRYAQPSYPPYAQQQVQSQSYPPPYAQQHLQSQSYPPYAQQQVQHPSYSGQHHAQHPQSYASPHRAHHAGYHAAQQGPAIPYGQHAPNDLMNRAQPVGQQLAPPAASPRISRFAWFVAGAAFGVTFAFFATGFVGSARSASADFPPAPPLPSMTAPAVQAATAPPVLATPPVAQAPVAPAPVATAPAVGTFASPGLLPPAPAPAPTTVVAPRSRSATRGSLSRRASAQPSPRALPGSGETEAPAPSAPAGGGSDVTDLLGAGLKP